MATKTVTPDRRFHGDRRKGTRHKPKPEDLTKTISRAGPIPNEATPPQTLLRRIKRALKMEED